MVPVVGLLIVAAAFVPGVPAPPDPVAGDPVVNGGFEWHAPGGLAETLAGTPVDECIGLGHQVFYGSETWQRRVEEAALAALENDTDRAVSNVDAAVAQWATDPLHEVRFLAGYGHCVSSGAHGSDVLWLNPAAQLDRPALHWSTGDGNTRFGFDFDDDPTGRSAQVGANGSASGHNLWQAWPSPFQAYTGNFDALGFRLMAETLSNVGGGASVIVSFSATPLEAQHPWVLLFLDCDLSFSAAQVLAAAAPIPGTRNAQVWLDPTLGSLRDRYAPGCAAAKAAWDEAEPGSEARREVLGRLRLVQLSFWGFNRGPGPVVIDDVSIAGASTFIEEAAGGNLKLPAEASPAAPAARGVARE